MVSFRAPASSYYNPGVLGGSGPNQLTYTKAQVGAAAKPNPAPPGATGWVGTNATPDPRRNQYPDSSTSGDPANKLPAPVRAFRGRGWGAPADVIYQGPGTQTPSGAVNGGGSQTLVGHAPSTGFDNSGQQNKQHIPAFEATSGRSRFTGATNAVVDNSRQWNPAGDPAGYPLAVSPRAYPEEYMTNNQAVSGVGGGGAVPAEWMDKWNILPQRTKAGGTSADDYRPARRWTQTPSMRPFDKNGLSYPNNGRHSLPSPLAGTPLFYPEAVRNGLPSPAGHNSAPGMSPIGVQQNTARLLPRAWDELLQNTNGGDAGAAVESSYRNHSWKAS
jgi:hypothetical protein